MYAFGARRRADVLFTREEHDDDRNKEEDKLNISFRDNETLCDGQIFQTALLRAEVSR